MSNALLTHSRRWLLVLLGIAISGVLVVIAATPANAATSTWFNRNATFNTYYTEASAAQSRTGERAGFTESNPNGTLRIYVYFGTANTSCWDYQCQINDARSYKKGKFKFNGYASEGEKIGMKAQSLNLGSLSIVAGDDEQEVSAENSDLSGALVSAAQDWGLADTDLSLLNEDDGARIYSAEAEGRIYLFIANGDVVASTWTNAADLEDRSLTISTNVPDSNGAATERQYLLVPSSAASAVDSAATDLQLENLGDGLYKDLAFQTRTADEQVTVTNTDDAAKTFDATRSDFTIRLSKAPEYEG